MKYAIIIMSSFYSTQNSISALLFARALIKRKHQLISVFFYSDGVFNANKKNITEDNEINLIHSWKRLSVDFNIRICVCVKSAFQRGLIFREDFKKVKNSQELLDSKFKLSGLLVFAEITQQCDRILQF